MRYTQALVDGYRIVLRHSGVEYAYHGRGAAAPFLCEQPTRRPSKDPAPPELKPRID